MQQKPIPQEPFEQPARILSRQALSQTAVSLELSAPGIAQAAVPGQFVNVQTAQFLRRPIGIMDRDLEKGTITLGIQIVGEGTAWLARQREGDVLNVLGPLGNGFDFAGARRIITVGGGAGVFPLHFVQQWCREKGLQSLAVCGYRSRSESVLSQAFEKCGCQVLFASEAGDMDLHGHAGQAFGQLLDSLDEKEGTIVMACGPRPMLQAIASLAQTQNLPCQVSLEERMACGIGICLVCACKVKAANESTYARLCVDGPVFDAREVVW